MRGVFSIVTPTSICQLYCIYMHKKNLGGPSRKSSSQTPKSLPRHCQQKEPFGPTLSIRPTFSLTHKIEVDFSSASSWLLNTNIHPYLVTQERILFTSKNSLFVGRTSLKETSRVGWLVIRQGHVRCNLHLLAPLGSVTRCFPTDGSDQPVTEDGLVMDAQSH